MLEKISGILVSSVTGLRLVLVVKDEEEAARGCDNLGVGVHDTTRPDRIHSLLVVPNAPLVQLDHDV